LTLYERRGRTDVGDRAHRKQSERAVTMSLKLCRNFLDDFDAVGAVAVDGENGVGDINMLSRWRKEVRDGRLQGRARRVDLPSRSAREIRQLQALKREHAMLKEEHELLKKRSWARVAHPAA